VKGKITVKKFIRARKAMSPAVSATIMVAATVVLVLVASNYAYQTLERQRGSAEFDAVKKSILTFDDAVRDVAWDIGGTRSVRFTVNYGHIKLVPNALSININVTDYPVNFGSYTTGYLKYNISTNYVTFDEGYEEYLLGNQSVVISKSTESYGKILVKQEGSWVNVILTYRVLVLKTCSVNVTIGDQPTIVNYVDIYVIRLLMSERSTYVGDFDLKAKNIGIVTETSESYDVIDSTCSILVTIGSYSETITVSLVGGTDAKVVFNLHVSNVQISI